MAVGAQTGGASERTVPVIVVENTYPAHPLVPRAEQGDRVRWELRHGAYRLVRIEDGAVVFVTAAVDHDGNRYSTGTPPVLEGVIGEVGRWGWKLEIREEADHG